MHKYGKTLTIYYIEIDLGIILSNLDKINQNQEQWILIECCEISEKGGEEKGEQKKFPKIAE